MYIILLSVEKIKTNLHSGQPFYLLTKTWKYDGSVFATEVPGGAQTE